MKKPWVLAFCFFLIFIIILSGCQNKGKSKNNNDKSISAYSDLAFTKDYFPGSKDVNNNFMGGTETMNIVAHKGKLFAGIGYWNDVPNKLDTYPGAQILIKDSANPPWRVDKSFGDEYLRVDSLKSITLTIDKNGINLDNPVNILSWQV